MRRSWILYLASAMFGFYSAYKAYAMMGQFALNDPRHSLGFYGWELSAGTFLLVAAIGFSLIIFDRGLDK